MILYSLEYRTDTDREQSTQMPEPEFSDANIHVARMISVNIQRQLLGLKLLFSVAYAGCEVRARALVALYYYMIARHDQFITIDVNNTDR